jgi:hypothetical protein
MRILDRLPIYEDPTLIDVQREVLQVCRNQILVWVSLRETMRPFPAILDTGHSHNFSMAKRHLDRWCGVELKRVGEMKIGMERVPQDGTEFFIHGNVRGSRRLSGRKYPLEMDQGIGVVPDDSPLAPRLPLMGLRGIIRNDLRLTIDGKRGEVTLR